jgi:hypothetical protein
MGMAVRCSACQWAGKVVAAEPLTLHFSGLMIGLQTGTRGPGFNLPLEILKVREQQRHCFTACQFGLGVGRMLGGCCRTWIRPVMLRTSNAATAVLHFDATRPR